MTSEQRAVITGYPPTILITIDESDCFWSDADLQAEIAIQARELGGTVQVCTLGGYMPAAFVNGRFI